MKERLITAAILGLPDLNKSFELFVSAGEGVAYGTLAPDWCEQRKPVSTCQTAGLCSERTAHMLAAMAVLIEESHKVTFGGKIKVYTLHNIKMVLSQKAGQWLTDSRVLRYELLLLSTENLELAIARVQNPAQFLYGERIEPLEHCCLEVIDLQTKTWEDLQDLPLDGERLWMGPLGW